MSVQRILLLIICWLPAFGLRAQHRIVSTEHFTVTGAVKKELRFTLEDLSRYPQYRLDSIRILNHHGEPRSVLHHPELVRLKDLLAPLELNSRGPKQYSEFFFTIIATDGYKVVFSWNELYNTAVGDSVFLIKGYDGRKGREMQHYISMISSSDRATGRRYVKGVQEIKVSRVL
ncbi:hypothetical protein GCM10027051_06170 [Niabella terrae]